MSKKIEKEKIGLTFLIIFGLAAPFLFPAYISQISFFWIFVVLAITWDAQGGQLGYNSFGNIFFFGLGMYLVPIVQISMYFDLGEWTAAGGTKTFIHTLDQYFIGFFVGLIVAVVIPFLVSLLLGELILNLRGQYFAICTLGLGVAAAELAGTIDIIGGGAGLTVPVWPKEIKNLNSQSYFFYFLSFIIAIKCVFYFRFIYKTKLGSFFKAIRDNENKAESMGINTTQIKTINWSFSSLFLGAAGGILGNIVGFIDPTDVAFAGPTYGVWMVLMAILGGKGYIWGAILGAVIFHFFQEFFWIYFLGWQRIALGLLIVVIVVFFPEGIMGWLKNRFPQWFGIVVEKNKG